MPDEITTRIKTIHAVSFQLRKLLHSIKQDAEELIGMVPEDDQRHYRVRLANSLLHDAADDLEDVELQLGPIVREPNQ